MKYELAESILESTMQHWDMTRMSEETKNIQIISEIKYDDYQQYTHGMRYVESLALWLRQFDSEEDKETAYRAAKDLLIYISEEEMRQLVAYAFPITMKQFLLQRTKRFCEKYGISDLEDRKSLYAYFRRCSMFLGLSDGAHMDFFRRQNRELSNEQVFVHYDFSQSKAEDMIKNQEKDTSVQKMIEKYPGKLSAQFYTFFLMDDFTGSGKSYIRKDSEGWHGKIKKFFKRLEKMNFRAAEAEIHLVLYVATAKALKNIQTQANLFTAEMGWKPISVDALQIVEPLNWESHKALLDLLKRNYERCLGFGKASYEDKHFTIGGGQYPYLGFADCSLPLVLYHNTPNNTLPVLWYSWEEMVCPLFPRVTRHKEN